MTSCRWLLLLALGGCFVDRSGTAVGNPTMDAQLARVAGGTASSATLPVRSITFVGCDGSVTTAQPGTLDLVQRDAVAMPDTHVCRVEVVPSGPLEVVGTTAQGGALRARLAVRGFVFTPDRANPGAYVVEIGAPGFVDVTGRAGDVTLDAAGQAGYAAAVAAVESASTMFVDRDQDGAVSDEERANGAVAVSSPIPDDNPDTDSGDTDDDTDSDSGDTDDTDSGDTVDTADTDSDTDTL